MREEYDAVISNAEKAYEYRLHYIAPEIYNEIMKKRDPVKLVKKLVSFIPADSEYDFIYKQIADTLYDACTHPIVSLQENFWLPMSNKILPKLIEEIDTEWKQQIINCWMNLK